MLKAVLIKLGVLCLLFSLAVSAYVTLYKVKARNVSGMLLFVLLTLVIWIGAISVAVAGVMVHP
ncbi:hypothetical protein CTH_2223 [Carboxydocella thermautotrophica]|nr:hypothetical protein CTH_2223 [Carboxydocella thermautotrophica]